MNVFTLWGLQNGIVDTNLFGNDIEVPHHTFLDDLSQNYEEHSNLKSHGYHSCGIYTP